MKHMGPHIQRINATLVILELALIVLPAAVAQLLTALILAFALTNPYLLLAYFVGWWGLASLLRIFISFIRPTVRIGPATLLGLFAGCLTVIALLYWASRPSCANCESPQINLGSIPLCIIVAVHWSILHFNQFRLTFRSKLLPSVAGPSSSGRPLT